MEREPFHSGLDHPRDTLPDGTEVQGDDFEAEDPENDEGPRMGLVVALGAFVLIITIGLTMR
jgi:hypothetical protein